MTSRRDCYVYLQLPGSTELVTCGRYERETLRTGEILGHFTYGRRYRERRDAVPVEPFGLPVLEGTATTNRREGLFGALADAGPDAWGRRVIDKRGGAPVMDALDYLLNAPQERFGALQFGLGSIPPPPVPAYHRRLSLAELRDAARRIEESDPQPVPEAAAVLLDSDSSLLGGMRPKAVIEEDGRLWVAKFPARNDRWTNATVEAAMLRLARLCGIRVPETRIESVGDERVLLVERFDRTPVADGTFLRARAVSGLTVLDADESTTDREKWSYLLLADELRRWVGPRARTDLPELFRRMVFNACIANTDDHPKNHALIAPSQDWQLAPAYDLTPSPRAGRTEVDLALECGLAGRRARRDNLLSATGRFLLTDEDATAMVETIVSTVQARWAAEVRAAGGTEADCDAIASAMVPPGFFFTDD
jgi:serine/threonine-protein kinase HipA